MLLRFLALVLALACATGPALASGGSMQLPPQPKVRPQNVPAGYVMVSPCVPAMGEHWANPQDPRAPIYGTHDGKVVFTEIMVTKAQLDKGFSFLNLRALPGQTIDHVDIEYEPHGHEGMPIPHYDVHAYYVGHSAHMAYCPAA